MPETPAAGAIEAQQAQAAAEAAQAQAAAEAARLAAEGAMVTAANVAAGAQEIAAEKTAIMADKTQDELNRYSERMATWRDEINQNLSASQAATEARLQKLQEQQESLAAGQLLLVENLKSLTPPPLPEIQLEMTPEELARKEAEAAQRAAQTNQRKPRRQRI